MTDQADDAVPAGVQAPAHERLPVDERRAAHERGDARGAEPRRPPNERPRSMTGYEYKRLVARYLLQEYAPRGIQIYDEVNIGTSIIGKQRRIDLLLVEPTQNQALAIECKYQDVSGTADEKIPYALRDLGALRMPACIVYAGSGFSEGVLHLLQSSEYAAYCLPDGDLARAPRRKGELNSGTWQLDHMLAVTFRWWDIVIGSKQPLTPTGA